MRSILALAGASLALSGEVSQLGTTTAHNDGTDYDYDLTVTVNEVGPSSLSATNAHEEDDLFDSFWKGLSLDDDDDDSDSDDDNDDDHGSDSDNDDDLFHRSPLFRHHHGHRGSHGHRSHWKPSPFMSLIGKPKSDSQSDDYDNDVPSLLLGLLSMVPGLLAPALPQPFAFPPHQPPQHGGAMFTFAFGGMPGNGPQPMMPPRAFPPLPPPRTQTFFMHDLPQNDLINQIVPFELTQVEFMAPPAEGSSEEPTGQTSTEQQQQQQPPQQDKEVATQPPATQPPATQPPATQPPATQPPATKPIPATPLKPAQPMSPQAPVEIAPPERKPVSLEFAPPTAEKAASPRPDIVSYRSAP